MIVSRQENALFLRKNKMSLFQCVEHRLAKAFIDGDISACRRSIFTGTIVESTGVSTLTFDALRHNIRSDAPGGRLLVSQYDAAIQNMMVILIQPHVKYYFVE